MGQSVWPCCVVLSAAMLFSCIASAADTVFLYSSTSQIRGINLDLGTENVLTTSPFTNSTNALATNADDGLVYYGSGTEVFVWDIALGNNAAAHSRLNNFANGAVQAPITNLNSGSGSYLAGVYYVGSEEAGGDAEDIFALTMSADGRTVVSAQALNLLSACNCTGDDIGGFGDIAAVLEGGSTVLYGISASGSDPTRTGRWRFDLGTNTWTHLSTGANGQLSNSISGQLYTNVGNGIRTVNKTTGALGGTNLFTVAAEIYDFTGGFSLDFGDAPASYGAAIHRVPPQTTATTFLGSVPPDNEAGSLNTVAGGSNGQGDDQAGTDDEDAVASLNAMTTSDPSYAFAVSCTAGAFVSAWIDLNLNGSFDANERSNNAPQLCNGTSTTLAWTSLSSTIAGTSYARIRVADVASDVAQPTGLSDTGEIEDHILTIVDNTSAGSCPAGQVSTIYNATDIPKTIPVGQSSATSSVLTVPTTSNVLDLNVVNVVGTHTWVEDIRLSLIRGATTVALFGPACGNLDDFNVGFDDESTNSLVCPPVNGNNLTPTSPLSVFEGVPATGDWTLDIVDVFPTADGGVLQSWALQVCTQAQPAEIPEIRLGKVAVVEDDQVRLTFRALNSGDTSLSDIGLFDNLDDAFGSNNYSIVQAPRIISSPAGFIANTAYTGNGLNTDLLGNAGTLAPGQELVVQLIVSVDTFVSGASVSNYTNQASITAIGQSNGFTEDLSAPSLDLSIDTDAPTPITIRSELTVSGRVFIDSSTNAATSHDGLFQLDEKGVDGRLVSVFNEGTGALIDEVFSDGNGEWAVALDGALEGTPLQIRVQPSSATAFVSEASQYSIGSVSDGVLRVIPQASTTQSGINIGVVEQPVLQTNRTQTALPNTSIRHAHRYVASSPGLLQLSLSENIIPASTTWPSRLLLDQNCNGVIDVNDALVSSDINVVRDQELCVIVDVFVPANAPMGTIHTAQLSTTLLLDDIATTGHAVQFETVNLDTITVLSAGIGRLVLEKTVRNITLGGSAVLSNSGLPGHVLEYTIRYVNQGAGPVDELIINDAAPAFTQVLGGSVQCVSTPAGISCTPGVASAEVQWDFIGTLAAGASGTVRYQVVID